jgi:hypothetical protein
MVKELLRTADLGDSRIRKAIANTVATTKDLVKLKTVEDINGMIKRLNVNKAAMNALYKDK